MSNILKCSKCENNLTKGAKFCPECGEPVPKQLPKVQEIKEFNPILKIDQAASFLGVSRCQVYILIKTDGLPWFPMGGSKRFIADELIAWAKNKQVFGQAM